MVERNANGETAEEMDTRIAAELAEYFNGLFRDDPDVKHELAAFVVGGVLSERGRALLTAQGLIFNPGRDIAWALTDKGSGMAHRLGYMERAFNLCDECNAPAEEKPQLGTAGPPA